MKTPAGYRVNAQVILGSLTLIYFAILPGCKQLGN